MAYKSKQHWLNYQKLEVGRATGTVAPFTSKQMMAVELGCDHGAASDLIKEMLDELGASEWNEYLSGELSEQQLAALKEKVEEKVLENLGVIQDVLDGLDKITPEFVKKFEAKIQDKINALAGDELNDFVSNVELPESIFEDLCEEL